MDIAQSIKSFLPSSFPNFLSQLWHRSKSLLLSPEIDLESQTQMPPSSSPVNMVGYAKQELVVEWQKILMEFCFVSGLQIALQIDQISPSKLHSFHLLSFSIVLLFACLFVSQFLNAKFPRVSEVLDKAAIFLGATMFFFTIAIPFPLTTKCVVWTVYALSLITVMLCNCI